MKQTRNYDVIISGGGPVGLFLACELALAKCSVLILEQTENPSSPLKRIPFGIRGLSAPSIEALDRRGLLQELEIHKRLKNPHKTGAPVDGPRRQVGHFAGIPFLEGNIDFPSWKNRLSSSTQTSLISEIEELETVLSRRAESLGVIIKRGFTITGFEQSEDHVVVLASESKFEGRWLVGCDGAKSIVRKQGEFYFIGTEPEFTGYSTSVDISDASMLKPGRNVTAKGMYMQSQPGYVVMQDFDGGAFHGSRQELTQDHVQEVLRRISGTDVVINKLNAATAWTDRARQVSNYRDGQVLLAGDAAHIHSPLGGQGLNLGLGDAMNLGWKLAAVIKLGVAKSILDTYQEERHPIGVQVLDWSRAQVEIMKPTAQARALHSIVRDLIETRDCATYFAGRVWGIATRYELGSDHPLVGQSAPNFEFDDGSKLGELMREGNGLLINFRSDHGIEAIAREYIQLEIASGKAKEQLGLSALLVRPDGIVAWVSEGKISETSLREAATRWFQVRRNC